ncbi:MAG: hypothetical protein KKC68_06960, partial [Candidatus Thermoplasmatota archaeon]|nr:hypothetical protein [Candidatus Thermoplasmatota archaeon]MBU1941499.1 hypothetical protein [Candidatus Thermoplasmatota archaeon]
MICFSQQRYIKEIRDLLNEHGHTTQQSQLLANNKNSIFNQLIQKGWIKEIPKDERELLLKDIKDGRAKRRQYYQSSLTPIINMIDQQITLAKNERRQLKHLLEKQSFRQLFSWENGIRSFYLFIDFLGQFTLWIFIASRYTDPYRD